MASINLEDWFGGKEEYEKGLKEMMESLQNNKNLSTAPSWGPSPIWTHGQWIMEDEEIIPLEQDENGVYGYKVLVKTGEKWLLSPNYQRIGFPCKWINDQLHAYIPPKEHNDSGIYCTKDVRELSEWFQNYQREFYCRQASLVIVRIQVWGTIIEHSKGLRAEYARIERIVGYGHR